MLTADAGHESLICGSFQGQRRPYVCGVKCAMWEASQYVSRWASCLEGCDPGIDAH